ncbi:MAG: ammonium transporter [Deltaproteobacteria bacterium]|nr:ammonium transporter [Deltaproteobacteria bacterium]MBW2211859.1 ammonium transporter [Deltaproteobacteria bacterium]MBW2629261.1 ammonium transporter [Deltaproteobacteria bacterium]
MKRARRLLGLGTVVGASIWTLPATVWAQDGLDTGDTAWILTSTALVLFMTIPGLALFYGGLVRTKNVLSVLMHCFVLTALVTVIWLVAGYSLAFDTSGMTAGTVNVNSFIGTLNKAFLHGVAPDALWGSIPEVLFFMFQLTFAIITPALIVGAFAERMKFSAMMLFSAVWVMLVYLPICHMTWGGEGGLLADMGALDFAGGIVVHLTAGTAALVAAVMVGPRKGHPDTPMTPHNMTMCLTGTGMLWVGWFGFNGGSALAANGDAAMAILVTQTSASVAALTWIGIEWVKLGKPSALGFATGAIAGLAAVTPASGFIGPEGAVVIGLTSGVVCWWAATQLKIKLGYDDALDVLGVHGVGGLVGVLLVSVFASTTFGGNQEGLDIGAQLKTQSVAAVITILWTVVGTYLSLKVASIAGLRVDADDEEAGLDLTQHTERGYDI